MSEKKPYATSQLFEVLLDLEQAILTSCSTATIATSAGGTNESRPPTGCNNYPGASPLGCKRSVVPLPTWGEPAMTSGPRAS